MSEVGAIDRLDRKLNATMLSIFEKAFHGLPMGYRLAFILSTFEKNKEEAYNWLEINKLLRDGVSSTDFNVFGVIKCKEDLRTAWDHCRLAMQDKKVWCIQECKECGKKFNLFYGELKFYDRKGLKPPKRCSNCRELRGNKPAQQLSDFEIEAAMEFMEATVKEDLE